MASSLDYDFGHEDVAHQVREAGKALVLARHELNARLGDFLNNASTPDEFVARLAHVDDVLSDVAHRKMAHVSDSKAKLAKALFEEWKHAPRAGRPANKQSPNFNVRPAADKHVVPMDQNGDPGPYNRVKGVGGLEDEEEEDRGEDMPDLFDRYSAVKHWMSDTRHWFAATQDIGENEGDFSEHCVDCGKRVPEGEWFAGNDHQPRCQEDHELHQLGDDPFHSASSAQYGQDSASARGGIAPVEADDHVDPAASTPHEYSGKFEAWRNSNEPCLHCGQPKEHDVHRPSYSDEPQEMTDVLGPRPSRHAGAPNARAHEMEDFHQQDIMPNTYPDPVQAAKYAEQDPECPKCGSLDLEPNSKYDNFTKCNECGTHWKNEQIDRWNNRNAAVDDDDEGMTPRQRRHQEALDRISNPSVVDEIRQNNHKGPKLRVPETQAPCKNCGTVSPTKDMKNGHCPECSTGANSGTSEIDEEDRYATRKTSLFQCPQCGDYKSATHMKDEKEGPGIQCGRCGTTVFQNSMKLPDGSLVSATKTAVIEEEDGKYKVKSPHNKNWNGGEFDSKGQAEKRLEQVEYFKSHPNASKHAWTDNVPKTHSVKKI